MRVGIDARIIDYSSAGIARYASGIITALSELYPALEIMELRSLKAKRHGNRSFRRLVTPPHARYESITLPIELQRLKLDLIHATDFFCPGVKRLRQILTVHDLYFLSDPGCMTPDSFRHYKRVLDYIASAAHIVCDSNATKTDLLARTAVPAENCTVVYPGIDLDLWGASMPLAQPPRDIILFVGTLEPRKNIARMLEAYSRVRDTIGPSIPRFVLAGNPGYRATDLERLIEINDLRKHVEIRSSVTDGELKALYRRARVMMYVSLAEGFGFPLLEAMSCEAPILTSKGSSTEEIAGNAACLVDPLSVEAIAGGLLKLLSDEALSASLAERGLTRVREFSWAQTAGKLAAVYREALQ